MSAWESFDDEADLNSGERSGEPLHESFVWLLTLTAAWLLFHLTAQPTIGVVAACSKIGWSDLRTAWWIRCHDSDKRRGRTCSWFYLALGLWKIALTAGAAMLCLGPVLAILEAGQPQGQPPADLLVIFGSVGLEAVAGLILSAVVTYIAFTLALSRRCKVWIDQSVTRARKQGVWPPRSWTTNRASALLITSLITLLATLIILFICLITYFSINAPAQRQATLLDILASLLALVFMIAGAGVILLLRDMAQRRVIARDPRECWGYEQN